MTFLLHHEFTKTFPLEFVAAYQLTNLTRSHEVKVHFTNGGEGAAGNLS
jgi:hypothetical protein